MLIDKDKMRLNFQSIGDQEYPDNPREFAMVDTADAVESLAGDGQEAQALKELAAGVALSVTARKFKINPVRLRGLWAKFRRKLLIVAGNYTEQDCTLCPKCGFSFPTDRLNDCFICK